MSRYKEVIAKARKPESQKAGKLAKNIPPPVEAEVNLSIKVPLRLRQHWAAEAKRRGTTLTAAISEALRDRFGEPEPKA